MKIQMNITRESRKYEVDVPTVDSVAEAKIVFNEVVNNNVMPKNRRDAANGLVEAFFVSHLREVSKDGLLAAIQGLQQEFPKCNPLTRALLRVKDFRNKNAAWKSVTL